MTHLHKVKYGPFIFGFHPSHLFHFDFFKPWRSFFSLSFFHSPSRPLFPFFIFHFFFFPFFSLFSLILVPPPLPLSSPTTTISLPQSNDFSHYPPLFLSFFLLSFSLFISLSLYVCVCVFSPFSPHAHDSSLLQHWHQYPHHYYWPWLHVVATIATQHHRQRLYFDFAIPHLISILPPYYWSPPSSIHFIWYIC